MINTQQSQHEIVRQHLNEYGSISAMEAWGVYGIRSVSSRISQLRRAGVPIRAEQRRAGTGQRYVRYHLNPTREA